MVFVNIAMSIYKSVFPSLTSKFCFRVDFHLKQRWNASSLQLPKNLFKDNDTDGIHISVNEEVLNSVWSPDRWVNKRYFISESRGLFTFGSN